MNRFRPGNEIELLRSGAAFFPALVAAVDAAEREVWLETYIFADDPAGRAVRLLDWNGMLHVFFLAPRA